MFCRLCVEGKKKNAFTTSSKVYKADSLHKHLTIKDHKNVVSLNNSNQRKIPDLFQRKKIGPPPSSLQQPQQPQQSSSLQLVTIIILFVKGVIHINQHM